MRFWLSVTSFTAAIVVNEAGPRPTEDVLAERRRDCEAKGWSVARVFRLRPGDVLADGLREVLTPLGAEFSVLYVGLEDFALLAFPEGPGNLYSLRDAFAANMADLCKGLDGRAMFYFPELGRMVFPWQLEREVLAPMQAMFAAERADWIAGIKERQAQARLNGARVGRHPTDCSCGAHARP